MPEERKWILVARKLSGEAGQKDVIELERLLQEDSESGQQFKMRSLFWKHVKYRNEDADDEMFKKLMDKINKQTGYVKELF